MPSTPLQPRDHLDVAALEPVVYDLAVLAAMLVVLGLATLLPGGDRSLPGTDLTLHAIVVATGTIAIVLWCLRAAPAVGRFVRSALRGPEPVVADAGRIAGALVVFLAVLVADRGLAGVLVPALARSDIRWTYDVAFLFLALVPVASVANRLRRNLDVVTALVAGEVADRWSADDGVGVGGEDGSNAT